MLFLWCDCLLCGKEEGQDRVKLQLRKKLVSVAWKLLIVWGNQVALNLGLSFPTLCLNSHWWLGKIQHCLQPSFRWGNSFVSWCRQKVMIFLRDVQPFDFCGPRWRRKNFIEAHMKYTNTTEMLMNIYTYIKFLWFLWPEIIKLSHKIRAGYSARWFDSRPLRKAGSSF